MSKVYRALRVLEYVGSREFVDQSIEKRTVKGRHEIKGRGYIQEAIIGQTAELLDAEDGHSGKVQD